MDHKIIQLGGTPRGLWSRLLLWVGPAVRSSSGLCSVRSWNLPRMETAQPPQATCAPIQLSVLRQKTFYPCNQCELLSFQLVSTVSWPSTTEMSLEWCHSFSEKKSLLILSALLFICLCKVHFALWFRLLFQILTLLTAFAKNSNITKSEWKWKTNLRIKLGWKCSPMWSHQTFPDVPWWWQHFSTHYCISRYRRSISLYRCNMRANYSCRLQNRPKKQDTCWSKAMRNALC